MRRLLLAEAGTFARLSFYPPGLRQAAHSHERAHVSIIVAGSIREVSAAGDEIGSALQFNLRPYQSTHRVIFGPQRALILAANVEHIITRETASGWIHRNLSAAERALLKCMLDDRLASNVDIEGPIHDLLAGIEEESFRGAPPRWLLQARARLIEDPTNARIDALARTASVHRAHFARAFQHWFKTSPSAFQRRAMLSRAIACVASGQSHALAAHAAGFADQSHMCRTMRSLIGTTPHRLLRRA
ncbi:MAG: helix-turn-helix domain-containing protein [Steroidobacteraceae bacterium]